MTGPQENTPNLAGFQSERRTLSAMHVRIDYQSLRYVHNMRPQGSDWLFNFSIFKEQLDVDAQRPAGNLDPYAIRRELDAINTSEKAVRFLSGVGKFRAWQSVFWSQCQAWKDQSPAWREFFKEQLNLDIGAPRAAANLDPYAVRREFEAADTPDKAIRFLSGAGTFWIWRSVLWSQFREWQEFFSWLRLDHDEAQKTPEGKRAWDTAGGLGNTFFTTSDADFTRARFPPDAEEIFGPENWKRNVLDDRQRLRALRGFALFPERAHEGSPTTIGWYDPDDWLTNKNGSPPENWKEQTKKALKRNREPYLRIEALEHFRK